jgi:hypothetical protein
VKITLIVADGVTTTVLDALKKYWIEPEAKRERERLEQEKREAAARAGAGILAAPGEIAADVGGTVSAGLAGLGEAFTLIAAAVAGQLEAGAPLSFTLVEEQGGFRLRVPGSSPLVDTINGVVANLPLLLPQGGNLLHAELKMASAEGNLSVSLDVTAAADWSQLTLVASLKGSEIKAPDSPRSLEIRVTGVARQGLYDAVTYESDVTAKFKIAMVDYAQRLGIKLPGR